MALKKLDKNGYGQLELNFAAFRRYGAIESQCRFMGKLTKDELGRPTHDKNYILENGMILAVDRARRVVDFPTGKEGEVYVLNYTSEHMYDERAKALKDFKLDADTFCPRLGYIGKADKFTTNTVCYDSSSLDYGAIGSQLRDYSDSRVRYYGRPCLEEGFEGYIEIVKEADKDERCILEVLEATTMPDGQRAFKFGGLN